MRKLIACASLLLIIPLAACGLISKSGGTNPPSGTAPTQANDAQVQTQIAEIMLTTVPTAAGEVTPTPGLPTVEVVTATPSSEAPASAETPTVAETPASGETPAAATPTVAASPAEPTQTPLPPTSTPEKVSPTNTPGGPTATATVPPAPTFTPPAGDPRAKLGNPTSTDPMDNATAWVWPTGSDQYTSGEFTNGYQVVTALSSTDGWRLSNPLGREFSSLYLEGTFRTNTCAGSDHYGLMVRVPSVKELDQGYLFGVTCDGKYSLRRWNGKVGTKGEMKYLVNWTSNAAIAAGSNQVNRLGIFTVGNRLILYVNGSLLTEVKDATFPSGYFGMFIGAPNTKNMTVQIDSMSYWENPQP